MSKDIFNYYSIKSTGMPIKKNKIFCMKLDVKKNVKQLFLFDAAKNKRYLNKVEHINVTYSVPTSK